MTGARYTYTNPILYQEELKKFFAKAKIVCQYKYKVDEN